MTESIRQSSSINHLSSHIGSEIVEQLAFTPTHEITAVTPWSRGGNETYVTDFTINDGINDPLRMIAKACIKLSPSETMNEWNVRRSVLSRAGIQTPTVYACSGPTIVEEFILYTLEEAFQRGDSIIRESLRSEYLDVCSKLALCGFNTSSLHDARSRGSDVVLIDMGSDLGPLTGTIRVLDALKIEASFRKLTGQRSARI